MSQPEHRTLFDPDAPGPSHRPTKPSEPDVRTRAFGRVPGVDLSRSVEQLAAPTERPTPQLVVTRVVDLELLAPKPIDGRERITQMGWREARSLRAANPINWSSGYRRVRAWTSR